MIDFKDRSIIDIGSNIGDTPLFFAKMGCSDVLGFEPVKELHDIGVENLKYNSKYSDKIKLINKAVGGKRGKINIDSSFAKDWNNEDSYMVDVITIEDVINNYDIHPDILKMDCEGCEFEIILNSDLSMFNDIIFEHHSYITGINHELLIKKLKEENFNINIYNVNATKRPFEEIGIIHAHK